MRILVSGWIGSTNLGDELVFAGVRRLLAHRFGPDVRIAAVSTRPAATRAQHDVAAIDHRRPDHIAAAARGADLVVFGGGGLVQDETSPFNLPYHLARPVLARLGRTPVVGLGLGIGPLDTALGRRLARTLAAFDAVTVRDTASQQLAAELGVPAARGTDTAWHLAGGAPVGGASADDGDAGPGRSGPGPRVEGEVVVALRPWGARRGRLPVQARRSTGEPDWFVPTIAAALDRLVQRTGVSVHLTALQSDRDDALHARVAAAMRQPVVRTAPGLDEVLSAFTGASCVVAMRYHAGVAATMAAVPSVLIGYSTKVDALAGELGAGAVPLAFTREDLERLDEAVVSQLAAPEAPAAVAAARDRLLARRQINLDALDAVT